MNRTTREQMLASEARRLGEMGCGWIGCPHCYPGGATAHEKAHLLRRIEVLRGEIAEVMKMAARWGVARRDAEAQDWAP